MKTHVSYPSAIQWLFISLLSIVLWGCGSSSSTPTPEPVTQVCETQDDPNEEDECGLLLLGLTDADGDFLSYSVDVQSISLTRRDGTQVQLLPTRQTVDFAQYVDLTELVTAATVPAGIYTQGSITLDYSNANIQVEKNGEAVAATMVDADGNPVNVVTLDVQLDNRNQLVIARGIPALLELDFNLAASHTVNLDSDPITVTTEPFISAEVEPVVAKEFRIRGPLIRVDEDNDYYRIAVRPFYNRDQRHGGVNIYVDENTHFEIDGTEVPNQDGLATLAQLPQATATVAFGTYNRELKRFTAAQVLAGSSVPGHDMDAAKGVIIAREGDLLTLKGATLIRDTGDVSFRNTLQVQLSDATRVVKARDYDGMESIDSLSPGQAVTVAGYFTDTTAEPNLPLLDASEGYVRMRLTAIAGHVVNNANAELVLNLQSIQGRSVSLFDFSGTGIDPSYDADPTQYQVNTGNLMTDSIAIDDPVRVLGFVNAFGQAPADFDAWSVIDYSEGHSHLLVSWINEGTANAFTEITEAQLTFNLSGEDLGHYHHVAQGAIRTDLTQSENNTQLVPKFERGLYGIKGNGSIMLFTDFAEFSAELASRINDGELIKLVHAQGGYQHSNGQFSAYKISVVTQ
jgi:hypothetical protein